MTPPNLRCSKRGLRSANTSEPDVRDQMRRGEFSFDPTVKLMTTVDERDGGVWVDTKGAPEVLVTRCTMIATPDGNCRPLTVEDRRSAGATRRR